MNWLAIARAAVTYPPRLPRRSSTIAFLPDATSALRSLMNWADALSEKPVTAM